MKTSVRLILIGLIASAPMGMAFGQAEKKSDAKTTQTPLMSWSVPVVGLTNDNTSTGKKAIEGLKLKADPKAKMDKVEGSGIQDVRFDMEKSMLFLTLQEHRQLRLSDLKKALESTGIRVDAEKLVLQDNTELVVRGDVTADQMSEIDTALEQAGYFKKFTHRADEKTGSCHFQIVASTPKAKLSSVKDFLAEFYGEDMEAEVIWTGLRSAVAPKG
ncbi:MAG: hypothetical protein RL885_08525 [Planctomycetota bacterium]